YDEAKAKLMTTPVAAPVFFTLTGPSPGQGCVIERRATEAILHEGPEVTGNHWINDRFHGRPRPIRSHDRREKLQQLLPEVAAPLDWVQAPVLNRLTRLACEMNAATGSLVLQGWVSMAAATRIFAIP